MDEILADSAGKTQVWLITGSSRGLGRALCDVVLAAGHNAVVTARRAEELGLDSLWVLERILRPVAPGREPLLPPHSASV